MKTRAFGRPKMSAKPGGPPPRAAAVKFEASMLPIPEVDWRMHEEWAPAVAPTQVMASRPPLPSDPPPEEYTAVALTVERVQQREGDEWFIIDRPDTEYYEGFCAVCKKGYNAGHAGSKGHITAMSIKPG